MTFRKTALGGDIGARPPEPYLPGLGLLPQPLEIAAVGVGEGGGAGETQGDEVLVEEVFVASVAVRVEVDVG